MVRWIIVILLGLFFGASPKRISRLRLLQLFALNTALSIAFISIALVAGIDLVDVLTLNKSHITTSALTVTYALSIGLLIKFVFTKREETQVGSNT